MTLISLNRFLSIKLLPVWAVLFVDSLIILFSLFLSNSFLREYCQNTWLTIEGEALLILGVNLLFFRLFRTYSGVMRYTTVYDITKLTVALCCAFLGLILSNAILFYLFDIKLIAFLLLFSTWILCLLIIVGSRIFTRAVFDLYLSDTGQKTNVMIYGAQEAGISIAKALQVDRTKNYNLCGFIADEDNLIGKSIWSGTVIKNDAKVIDWIKRKRVTLVIVSPAKRAAIKDNPLFDLLIAQNVKILLAPPMSEWVDNQLTNSQLKEICVEDLLERSVIEIDFLKIAETLEGKRILVTGAAGSIGSEIVRQVAGFNPSELILIDQAETPLHDMRLELSDKYRNVKAETVIADISNQPRMEDLFKTKRPHYVFHAAAYKHVPMMEDNVSESVQVNVNGTRILADLAVKYAVDAFVMISTDKAVNPTNIMGTSKRIAEIYVQSLAKKINLEEGHKVKFITTRFGNVLGSNGSVIPRFREQIKNGGPVTVTHPEIVRFFMTIPEACRLVLEAGSHGAGGEIFVFDMGNPVKIVDLAKRMISLSGFVPEVDIKIVYTGLRDGEKLYEEVLHDKEKCKPTHHPLIKIAAVKESDFEEIKREIDELVRTSFLFQEKQTVKLMQRLVPEFKSTNLRHLTHEEE